MLESGQAASAPRLLACHDMRVRGVGAGGAAGGGGVGWGGGLLRELLPILEQMDVQGGYLDDRLPQGSGAADFYTFTQWPAIDLFVYFTHKLVTIPPPGWINSGHHHATPVLGTLISEWDAGAAACLELFGSAAAAAAAAAKCAAIAAHYGFDGWLINIENALEPGLVPNVVLFLRCGTRLTILSMYPLCSAANVPGVPFYCRTLTELMHEAGPGSHVIWYDAVTTAGKLEWQNNLTPLNRPFFDACDGLFVNYTWKAETPREVRAAAGSRRAEVWMGIDCFGRNTYGGGGLDSNVALVAARSQGLSVALFAMAWPFDCGEPWSACGSWQQRDEQFWGNICAALGGAARPTVVALPFYTDFCVGSGQRLVQQGQPVMQQGWYNLSRQQPQPVLEWEQPVGDSITAAVSAQAAFSGANCFHVCGVLEQPASLRLFSAAVPLPPAGLRIAFTLGASGPVQPGLLLAVQQQADGSTATVRCGRGAPLWDSADEGGRQLAAPATVETVAAFVKVEGAGSSGSPAASATLQAGVQRPKHWVQYTSLLAPVDYVGLDAEQVAATGEVRLTAISLQLLPDMGAPGSDGTAAFELWMGDISLEPLGQDSPHEGAPGSVDGLAASDIYGEQGIAPGGEGGLELSLTLSWRPPPGGVARCHVWITSAAGAEAWEWVGQAHAPVFRVCRCRVVACPVRFAVQTVGAVGRAQSLVEAATVEVEFRLGL